jgi:hypothetical protein
MEKFIKKDIIDYKDDNFYLETNKLFGIEETKIIGSYIKYGKDKVCDLDLNETNIIDLDKLKQYFNKIYENKKKYYILEIYFNEPHKKLFNIYNKLGYLNGIFVRKDYHSIIDDINNLPDELKNNINNLINIYIKSQKIQDYIKIVLYIKKNLYPKWTIKELIKGKKIYYEQEFNINDLNFDYIYFEFLYNNFRVSNYINVKKIHNENNKYLIYELDDIVINDDIFYYKMLKKIMVFIKWLFFKKIFEEDFLYKESITDYNFIYEFIDKIGKKYNKFCILNNKIDKYKIKLNKYLKKNNKNKINKYQDKIKIKSEKYNNGIKEINDLSKIEYDKLVNKYIKYFVNNFRIY